jgi:hypothetical protein
VEFSSVNSYGRHPSLQPSYVFSASELPSSGSSGSIVRIMRPAPGPRWARGGSFMRAARGRPLHCGPHTVKHK